jgi:protein arginine kinase activator
LKCPLTGKNCLKHKAYTVEDVQGAKTTTHLVCEDCVHMKKQTDKSDDIDPCPRCGVTLDQVVRNSRVGCALCYDHFGEPLAYIIAAVQFGGETKHVGQIPELYKRSTAESVNPIKFATELAQRINLAIRNESYEEATTLNVTLTKVKSILVESNKEGELDPQSKAELADIIYRHLYPESA